MILLLRFNYILTFFKLKNVTLYVFVLLYTFIRTLICVYCIYCTAKQYIYV